MHMAHLPLIDYFPCPDGLVATVDARLEQAVEDFNKDDRPARLSRQPVASVLDESGHLYVPFVDDSEDPSRRRGTGFAGVSDKTIRQLREDVVGVVGEVTGADAGWQGEALRIPVRFDLMQFADLPPRVFQSAASFAAGAVDGVDLPGSTIPVEMVLIRFESDAAGEDWNSGGWAADLRWQIVNAYPFRHG